MIKLTSLVTAALLFATAAFANESKVLLAMEKTSFKEDLVKEMMKIMKEKSMVVTLVEDHKADLDKYTAADFDYSLPVGKFAEVA